VLFTVAIKSYVQTPSATSSLDDISTRNACFSCLCATMSSFCNGCQWLDLCQLTALTRSRPCYQGVTHRQNVWDVEPGCIKTKLATGKLIWLASGTTAERSPRMHRLWRAKDAGNVPLIRRYLTSGPLCSYTQVFNCMSVLQRHVSSCKHTRQCD
jgi:hypothetical protein